MSDAVTTRRAPTEAQLAANRRNAQRSTGPRSTEGKAVSRCNAWKHGLRAEELVLPTEDAEEYARRLDEWNHHYAPTDPASRLLVNRAVHASWRLDRCARAERAMLAERVTHAADDQQRQALDRAEDLGRRLIFDPDDNSYRHKREPWEQERFTRRAADHPAVLKRALESFAEGVDWLLARWRELEHTLTTFGTWEIPEAHLAARLLGRRPEDSTEDAVVTVLLLNMLRAMYEPGDYLPTYDAFARIRLFDSSRPVSAARVTLLEAALPPTPEEARAQLFEIIHAETARLRAWKADTLDARAEADRATAVHRAHFDDSAAAVLLRRYESACERELRRAAAELAKLDHGPREVVAAVELNTDAPAAPHVTGAPSNGPVESAVRTSSTAKDDPRSEPNATEPDAPNEPKSTTSREVSEGNKRDLSYSRSGSFASVAVASNGGCGNWETSLDPVRK